MPRPSVLRPVVRGRRCSPHHHHQHHQLQLQLQRQGLSHRHRPHSTLTAEAGAAASRKQVIAVSQQAAAIHTQHAASSAPAHPLDDRCSHPTGVGSCCYYHSYSSKLKTDNPNAAAEYHTMPNTQAAIQHQLQASTVQQINRINQQNTLNTNRRMSTIGQNVPYKVKGDPVVSIETNSIRYGSGALLELGIAVRQLTNTIKSNAQVKVAVFTDNNISKLQFFDDALQAIKAENLDVHIYSDVSVEPTDVSWKHAIDWCTQIKPDAYVSIGGGSVIDTCKAANLYTTYPQSDFLAYVNKPIGQGLIPAGVLQPHIAVPTTAGTGSESTGIAICDITSINVKTGVAHKLLRPTMAVIDPIVTHSLPPTVAASSAFDVLCHALESYTAVPHFEKATAGNSPRERFLTRPLSQGANRWADTGCLQALEILGKYLVAARDGNDKDAREHMMFASMLAGIAFGNAGVHIPHAMSYSVAGNVEKYRADHYNISEGSIVPHGMAVVLNAPAAFKLTANVNPRRHLEGITALRNGDVPSDISPDDHKAIGELSYQTLVQLMKDTQMPNGLTGVGYSEKDLKTLVHGAAQQTRLLSNAPCKIGNEELTTMYKDAMTYW